MLTTESEAKGLWCPFARVTVGEGHPASNRCNDGSLMSNALCIGSKCMAWRWGTPDAYAFRDTKGGGDTIVSDVTKLPLYREDPEHWVELGRCGLAGGL